MTSAGHMGMFSRKKDDGYWGLCFTAEQANSTIYMWRNTTNAPLVSLMYSTDKGETWSEMVASTAAESTIITLANVGDKVWIKAGPNGNQRFASNSAGTRYVNRFVMTGKIAASGNIMSLLNGEQQLDTIDSMYAMPYLFYNQKALTTAPYLPAATVSGYCYTYMFSGCTSLRTAPSELPALQLQGASNCYQYMFQNCTSLTTAPELPATKLGAYCYQCMFQNCTSLTTAPSELPAMNLASSCYSTMFAGCTSLTTAPSELPATTLQSACYANMFNGCTALTTAPSELPAMTMVHQCYTNMFNGCKSLTTAPYLPAATPYNYCYYQMFNGCTALNNIHVGLTTWDGGTTPLLNWVQNVAASGTFKCPSALGDNATITRGVSNCPEGWTVVNT